MFKKIMITTIALTSFLSLTTPMTASAKTTYLPKYIRSHTWYRLTDGTQGGYHDKTTFNGNHFAFTIQGPNIHCHWRFTGLKQHTKSTYYGRLHYSKKSSELVKIKIFNQKHFDIIPKHLFHIKGNYMGNERYGATIFKR